MSRLAAALALLGVLAVAAPASAHGDEGAGLPSDRVPPILREIGFDQHVGDTVPRDLVFRDADDHPVALGDLLGPRPVILTLSEYGCRNLCPFVLEDLARALRASGLVLGRDVGGAPVSFDPRAGPAAAARARRAIAGGYFPAAQRPGWHFLTGDEDTIHRLTAAVGFRYAYDAGGDQYAHPTGVVVLTPAGRIARYLLGMDYLARDIRLAVVEASSGRVGSVVDHVLLACYRYDAATGRYTPLVMTAVRAGGVATLLGMGLLLLVLFRGERRRAGGRA